MSTEEIYRLWVDDIRAAPDTSWVVARTVTSAIRFLAMFDVGECSLDHDISHQVSVGSVSRPYPCLETFQAVAHFIGMKHLAKPKALVPKLYIHSSNPVGADTLADILGNYGLTASATLGKAANRLEMEIN